MIEYRRNPRLQLVKKALGITNQCMATIIPPVVLNSLVCERSLGHENVAKVLVQIYCKANKSSREHELSNIVSKLCYFNRAEIMPTIKFSRVMSRNASELRGVIDMIEQDQRTHHEKLLIAALMVGSYL